MVTIDTDRRHITDATASRIRQLRIEQKLSQEELALRAGISPAYLGHIERGLKCPTIDTISKIVNALGITLTAFFDFSESLGSQQYAIGRIISSIQDISEQDVNDLAKIIEIISIMLKRNR